MIAKPKSRNRPLFMFAVGIVLVVAAVDILWLHLVSEPPKTGDDANLSTRGRKELVLDQVWGIIFLSTGIALGASAFLIKPSPYAAVTARGLLLRVGAPGTVGRTDAAIEPAGAYSRRGPWGLTPISPPDD